MPKNFWWIVSLMACLFLLGGGGFYVKQQKEELDRARLEIEALRENGEETAAHADRLLTGLEESKDRIERLLKEKEEVTQAQRDLETQMRQALESKDVTISGLQGKLTVNILDRILFDSGEAVLKPDGQAVLDQIAKVLSEYPNRQVQVMGHTDNVPIRANSKNPFHTNWELSLGRALAAVRYLTEKAGVDPRRLGAVGYGEFHPIADNSTAEGRAKNRRIALVVMPEDLAPTDILPSLSGTNAVSQASTNATSQLPTNAVSQVTTNTEPAESSDSKKE